MNEIEEKLKPFEQEKAILQYFKDNFTTNPKKLKKLALRLMPHQPDFIQNGLFKDLLSHPDPVGYLRQCFEMILDYAIVIENLIEDGCHGMIIYGKTIVPIRLVSPAKWLTEKDRWCPDQEIDIIKQNVDAWFSAEKMITARGRVVLFREHGFTGVARDFYRDRRTF